MEVDAVTKRFRIVFKEFQRDNPGFGQIEFAEKLKMTQSMVSYNLSGRVAIGKKALDGVVKELGYSPAWFVNGEGDKKVAADKTKLLTEIQMLQTEVDILRALVEKLQGDIILLSKVKKPVNA